MCTPIDSTKKLKLFKLEDYLLDNIKGNVNEITDNEFNSDGDIVNLIRWSMKQ